MRLARFYRDVREGVKFDPDALYREDTRFREAVAKHFKKMLKMEKKKYTLPAFSQALVEYTSMFGIFDPKKQELKDDLSKDPAGTSDEDN